VGEPNTFTKTINSQITLSTGPFHTACSHISGIPGDQRLDEAAERDNILIGLNGGEREVLVLDDIMGDVQGD
jgi:hypothetical protein